MRNIRIAAGANRQTARVGPVAFALAAAALGASAGLAASTTPVFAMAAAIAAVLTCALLLRPDWLPALLAATAFAETIQFGGVTISRLLAPLVLLVVVLEVLRNKRRWQLDRRLALAVGAYVTWALASVAWSLDPAAPFGGDTARAVGSLLISLTFAVAIALLTRSERQLRWLLGAIWAMASLTGGVAILQYLLTGERAVGYESDPNFFAALQVFALPIGVVLASNVRSPWARLACFAGTALIIGSIFVTLSRGGLLATFVVLLALSLQPGSAMYGSRRRKRVLLAVIASAGLVVAAVAFADIAARSGASLSSEEGGSGRANLWRAALNGWGDVPVHGMGFGAFKAESNDLLLETPGVNFKAYALREGGQFAHSAYLGTLAELGLIGLALFLFVLMSVLLALKRAVGRASRSENAFVGAASRGLAISLIGFAVAAVFLSAETDRALWTVIGTAMALPAVAARRMPTASTGALEEVAPTSRGRIQVA